MSDPAVDPADLAELHRLVADLRAEVADLRATVDRDRGAVPPGPAAAMSAAGRAGDRGPGPAGRSFGRRRALVGLAGAAAVGTAAALAPGSPAAAEDGDPLRLGEENAATSSTSVVVGGTQRRHHGIGVAEDPIPQLQTSSAVLGVAGGEVFDHGVEGRSATGSGVVARAGADGFAALHAEAEGDTRGVVATTENGVAVWGDASSGDGAQFQSRAEGRIGVIAAGDCGVAINGGRTHLYLHPVTDHDPITSPFDPGPVSLLATADEVEMGHGNPTLWANVGAPGARRWIKLAGHDTAGALHVLPTPQRAYDSRPDGAPAIGPKTPLPTGGASRVIDLKPAGVPAGATAALLTVQLVNAVPGAGNLRIWAQGQAQPLATTMVWGGTAGRFALQTTTAVSNEALVRVGASLQTHIVLDVVGYWR